jgi:hypothetical protein
MAERTYTPSFTATRTLGALALVVVGGVHYQQYRYAFYASIPTIGPLFLANFIGATALELFLLTPVNSRLGCRGRSLHRVAALAGIGVAAGGLVALLISEHTPVFGFMEHGYRFVIVLAIASDAVAIALLALFLVRASIGARVPRAVPTRERSRMPRGGERVNQQPVTSADETWWP